MTKTEINELEVAAKEGNALYVELEIVRRYTLETGGITITAEVQRCGETNVKGAGGEYLFGSEEDFKASLSDAVNIVKVEEV